jgi:hypothetical protein
VESPTRRQNPDSRLACSLHITVCSPFIHTCELEGVNPFQYLTALQRHADALEAHPTAWLPWNYQDTLAAVPSV